MVVGGFRSFHVLVTTTCVDATLVVAQVTQAHFVENI